MQLQLLRDEDTDVELATKLRYAGHDVERIVEVEALGTGSPDETVQEYARRSNRIIVTRRDDRPR